MGPRRLSQSSTREGLLTFRGGEGGAESIFYDVEPHRGAPGLGVLLTGMGSDGAAAMTELRAAGGHTIAEAKETAVVWGMPGELVARGGAVDTLPMDAIAGRLVELLA